LSVIACHAEVPITPPLAGIVTKEGRRHRQPIFLSLLLVADLTAPDQGFVEIRKLWRGGKRLHDGEGRPFVALGAVSMLSLAPGLKIVIWLSVFPVV
jgi:hypothetical protein